MIILRLLAGALGVALLGAIVWASVTGDIHGSIWDQGGVLLTLPWGAVAMLDLYVGFVFFALIMVLTERSLIAGLLWAAPIFVLGNVWAAFWLVLRLPRLADRLTRPDWPGASG